jgi:hypothetical protein
MAARRLSRILRQGGIVDFQSLNSGLISGPGSCQKKLAPTIAERFARRRRCFFFEENKLQIYFTRIFPFASSVPCTRTRFPSNLATSL